ncbi:MAG: glycerol-3-phosphate cytidylyltransferase [Sulfitobacter sp.]|jgi:glycerol-3-phosphate cytidylyltransferase
MNLLRAPHRSVLAYGVFDVLNAKEIKFLKTLQRLGNEVIIGCRSDHLIASQGRPCLNSFTKRRRTLESCRFVSRVIPEETRDQKRIDIVNYDVSALVLADSEAGNYDDLQDIVKILYISDGKMPESRPHIVLPALNLAIG